MKLAEALMERADAQKRLTELRHRINANLIVQDGDTPAEDPVVLVEEFERTTRRLATVVKEINRTNIATNVDGITLMEALAERDILRAQQELYRTIAQNAAPRHGLNRYSRSEIKQVSVVSVKDFQDRADEKAQAWRDLDAKIQAVNWTTDLIE